MKYKFINMHLSNSIYKFLLISFLILQLAYTQVPMVTPYDNAPNTQSFSSHTLVSPPALSEFNVTFPYGSFTQVPICYTAVFSIEWESALDFRVDEIDVTTTSTETRVTVASTVSKIMLRYYVLDSELYETTFYAFQYFLFIPPSPSIVQAVTIQNHEKYEVTYLKQYKGQMFSNYNSQAGLPMVEIVQHISDSLSKIKIKTVQLGGYAMSSFIVMMFNITPIAREEYPPVYYSYSFVATNTNNTLQSQVNIVKTVYPQNFFMGLHLFYDAFEDRGGCLVDIDNWNFLNTSAYVTTAMFYVKKCPTTDPYYNIIDGQCYLVCPIGTYKKQIYRECLPCTAPCRGCSQSNPSNCTSCSSPTVLASSGPDTLTCVCADGYYGSPLTTGCFECPMPNCLTCNSSSYCTSCYYGLVWISDKCDCENGTKIVIDEKIRCIQKVVEEECENGRVSYNDYYCECPIGKTYKNGKCR